MPLPSLEAIETQLQEHRNISNMEDFKKFVQLSNYYAFRSMQYDAWKTSEDHGFHENDPGAPTRIALMHSELSEALEEMRAGRGPGEIYPSSKGPQGVPIELAAVVIRILDFAECAGFDLFDAITKKMEFNQGRSHMHGGKLF